MMKRAFAAVLLLGAALSFGPASAQSRVQCSSNNAVAPEDIIGACSTALMQGASGEQRATILLYRGIAFMRADDPTHAVSDYSEAIRIRPTAQLYNNRGYAYDRLGRTQQARADYDRALQLDPRNAFANSNRGTLRLNARDYAGAVTDFTQALAVRESAGDHYNRGLAYNGVQNARAAIADFDAAARLDGANAGYHNARCWYRALANVELSIARQACDRAIQLSAGAATQAAFLDSRGLVYLRQERFRDAFNDYDAAVRQNESASYLFGRGYAAYRLRRTEQARADFVRAAALNPNIAAVYAGYGFTPPAELLVAAAPPPQPQPQQATAPPPAPQTQAPPLVQQTQTPARQAPPPTAPPTQPPTPAACDVAGIRVFFGAGQATLDPSGRQLLDVLLPRVTACRGAQLVLRGSIDAAEAGAGAGDLGRRRAAAVRDYLAQHGVAASSIALQDLAFTAPMVGTSAGVSEPQNRNVEFALMTGAAPAALPRAPDPVAVVQSPPQAQRTQPPPQTSAAAAPTFQPGGPGRHVFTYGCPDNSELRVTFDNDDQTAIVARIRRPPATLRAAPLSGGEFHYANQSYDLSGGVGEVVFRVGSGEPMRCPRRGG
ncbi:tetratricopeptide repeat protein [Terricaulis sp.]|uniref:tetratricopeptide repeat protein n=1 Tax=Terricaulis sp. TaxID=2768686 RepID=UPI003783D4B0